MANRAAAGSSDFDKWVRSLHQNWSHLPAIIQEILYIYWSQSVRAGSTIDIQFQWRVQQAIGNVVPLSPDDSMSQRAAELLPLLEKGPITDKEIKDLESYLDRKYGFSNPE